MQDTAASNDLGQARPGGPIQCTMADLERNSAGDYEGALRSLKVIYAMVMGKHLEIDSAAQEALREAKEKQERERLEAEKEARIKAGKRTSLREKKRLKELERQKKKKPPPASDFMGISLSDFLQTIERRNNILFIW